MEKKVKLVVGSSSWWKNLKYRNEAAKKLRILRKGWKLKNIQMCKATKYSIDTKIYKKYCFYK